MNADENHMGPEGDHMKDRGPHMSDEMAGNNAGGNNSPSAVNS